MMANTKPGSFGLKNLAVINMSSVKAIISWSSAAAEESKAGAERRPLTNLNHLQLKGTNMLVVHNYDSASSNSSSSSSEHDELDQQERMALASQFNSSLQSATFDDDDEEMSLQERGRRRHADSQRDSAQCDGAIDLSFSKGIIRCKSEEVVAQRWE